MKRYLPTLLLALLASTCTAAAGKPAATHTLHLHGFTFHVELATRAPQREKGLMQRTDLPVDHGMLFVFPHAAEQQFWMKNTLIPLDMLFFDKSRKLVSVQLDALPCKADPCPIYRSGKPAVYVLELAAGTVAQRGIETGDHFSLEDRVGPGH